MVVVAFMDDRDVVFEPQISVPNTCRTCLSNLGLVPPALLVRPLEHLVQLILPHIQLLVHSQDQHPHLLDLSQCRLPLRLSLLMILRILRR